MKPIQQRHNECSIAALCVLNSFSQADYEALSDLIRASVAFYDKRPHKFIDRAVKIAGNLGMIVPADYLCLRDRRSRKEDWPTATPELFKGKGVAWIKISPNSHVLAYQDGRFIDSDGLEHASYEAMRVFYRDTFHKRIKLIKCYPAK